MTEADIYDGLHGIFAKVFRRNDLKLTPELSAADVPGWDSFRYLSIIMDSEEFFRIKLKRADVDELKNVGDLVKAIARHLS